MRDHAAQVFRGRVRVRHAADCEHGRHKHAERTLAPVELAFSRRLSVASQQQIATAQLAQSISKEMRELHADMRVSLQRVRSFAHVCVCVCVCVCV